MVKEAQALCAKGGLHLHKFLSNNREVLDSINIEGQAVEVKNVDLNHDELPVQRVLGVRWNSGHDEGFFRSWLLYMTLNTRTAVEGVK